MKIQAMSVGPLGTNCYIVYNDNDAVIIDPGGDTERIVSFLSLNEIKPQAILLTHAHFDHIGAVDTLRSHYNIEVHLHEKEKEWLVDPELNGSKSFIGQTISTKHAERALIPGTLEISTFTFDVVHTPGHSPGSVSFIMHDELTIFGGDVLFRQGIGRTDLAGGDMQQLITSIRNELYSLNDNFVVYPGHGPSTTVGEEKQNNPFVSG